MFDLQEYLTQRRTIVDRALDAYLPTASTHPSLLHESMRYSVFSGGKRLRPILCMAAAHACQPHNCNSFDASETAMPAAIAVELLHTYTLIHDDLPCMDDDDLRRGKPTSHKVYGIANAVLTGDALQAAAFSSLTALKQNEGYQHQHYLTELADAAGSKGVIGGQVEDLIATNDLVDKETIQRIHLRKTASLFKASIRLGAMAANADSDQLQALTTYAVSLGLAFQITDDLLDIDKTSTDQGGELTSLSVYTIDQARQQTSQLISEATSAISNLAPKEATPLESIAQFITKRTE